MNTYILVMLTWFGPAEGDATRWDVIVSDVSYSECIRLKEDSDPFLQVNKTGPNPLVTVLLSCELQPY